MTVMHSLYHSPSMPWMKRKTISRIQLYFERFPEGFKKCCLLFSSSFYRVPVGCKYIYQQINRNYSEIHKKSVFIKSNHFHFVNIHFSEQWAELSTYAIMRAYSFYHVCSFLVYNKNWNRQEGVRGRRRIITFFLNHSLALYFRNKMDIT